MQRLARLIIVPRPGSDLEARLIFNHEPVYQGPVTGNIEWSLDSSIWGNIPMTLHLHGRGGLIWQDLHMNYSGCQLCLPGSESSGAQRIRPQHYYAQPSLAADCRTSVTVNGTAVSIQRDEHCQGAWHYDVCAPARVDAVIRIDRQKTMLWTPVI